METKSFKWSGWVKPVNQGDTRCSFCQENNQNYCSQCRDVVESEIEYVCYRGNLALDKEGKPITRTDEEMDNFDD